MEGASQDHKSGSVRSALVHNQLILLGVCFLLFLGTALGITYRSWSYPWFLDDLHQVRTYSPAEITSVFTGEWDVDKIETPAYRPLLVVFRHLSALAFGES